VGVTQRVSRSHCATKDVLSTGTPNSGRHPDLIANPVQVWANVDLSLLRGVPPVIAAIAMAAAHCFVGAINSFLGRHNMDAE